MSTRSHQHEETFPVTPERLFNALWTPSAICGWWGCSRVIVIAEPGGLWAATWGGSEDEPDYTTSATIRDFEPPRRMSLVDYRYRAKQGPLPFDADFETTFEVEPHAEGALLRVTQDGFPEGPEADDFYAGCGVGWKNTFDGIRRFLSAATG